MLLLPLLTLLALEAHASYDRFFFSIPAAANGTAYCPGMSFGCTAPDNVCAHDGVTDKYYCCGDEDYPLCRAYASDCSGEGGAASSSQTECSASGFSWCCLKDTEQCTQRTDQTNVCVATQANVIANLSSQALKKEFSSLSSADASATTLIFDATELAAAATSTVSSSALTTSTTSTVSNPATSMATASSTSTSTPGPDDLSGGAIAGVVVGCIAGLAALAAGAYVFFRRRRLAPQAKVDSGVGNPYSPLPGKAGEGYSDDGAYYEPRIGGAAAPHYALAEMGGSNAATEMSAEQQRAELPVGPGELQGSAPTK